MATTAGRDEIVVGIIDGPVDFSHEDLKDSKMVSAAPMVSECEAFDSLACRHGTFVAGMLAARRGSPAPALCPACSFVTRPIFCESSTDRRSCPEARPPELAAAIHETLDAGARVINLSMGLTQTFGSADLELTAAFDLACHRGVILVAAAGNQGRVGHVALCRHPWIIPVAACGIEGRLTAASNTGPSVGRRGLMAPGAGIVGTAAGGGYTRMDGTSVAAPWVTGAAALLWSLFPQASAAEVRQALLLAGHARRSVAPPLLDAEASFEMLEANSQRLPIRKRCGMDPDNDSSNTEFQDHQTGTGIGMQNVSGFPPASSTDSESVQPATLAERENPGLHIEPECKESSSGSGIVSGEGRPPSYVYALGTIEARFPSLAVDREFAQAVQEGDTASLTDQQVFHKILSQEQNRYLARELCWAFSVEHVDTYVLVPRTDVELGQLIEAIKPADGIDVNAVIGTRGPLASPEMCNGLQVPVVICDRIYSFEVAEFVKAIPKPPGMKDAAFENAAQELFLRIMQLADNAGEQDEHRAVNYLALRYPVIYAHVMEMFAADKKLAGVGVRPSRLSGSRNIVDVVLSFVNRKTDVTEKYFVRLDVTEKWPFLVSKLQPFYER